MIRFKDEMTLNSNSTTLISLLLICLALLGGLLFCGFGWVRQLRLQRSRNRVVDAHQVLLEATPSPMLMVAENGTIEVANRLAGDLLDSSADTLRGRNIDEFVPALSRQDHMDYRRLFFSSQGKRTMRSPVTLQTATNATRRVEVLIGLYQQGEQRYGLVNLVDVSRVEDMEQRTSKMEEKFRITFELAPIGIAQISLDGRFVQVNRQLATIMGYNRKELEGMTLDDLTPPQERNANRLLVQRLVNREVDHLRLEKRYLDRAGDDLWVTHTMTLYRDLQGKPEYLISIFEDISHRKNYEAELLASEAKFRTIANHVNGVVWMATPGNDKALFVNNRYPEIWGRSIESLMRDPSSFMDAIVPEDRPRVEAEMENHRKGVWNVNYRISNGEGEIRYIHDEGLPVRSANGDMICLVGMARDVTEERLAQEKLERSNRQLEQLAKFDPLTMSVRRPYALEDLDECIALHRRYHTEASLIFIDLNDFKLVNDQYGHEAGDNVLIAFAQCVRENIRATDGFYRYAGDEFLLLLRETQSAEASRFLGKLVDVLAAVRIEDYESVRIAISHGAVTLGEVEVTNANDWIRQADTRMYECKNSIKAAQR